MSDVTHILGQMEGGDGQTAGKLLPVVYDELRTLATARMPQENPGQTLQGTALVHEAHTVPFCASTGEQNNAIPYRHVPMGVTVFNKARKRLESVSF